MFILKKYIFFICLYTGFGKNLMIKCFKAQTHKNCNKNIGSLNILNYLVEQSKPQNFKFTIMTSQEQTHVVICIIKIKI